MSWINSYPDGSFDCLFIRRKERVEKREGKDIKEPSYLISVPYFNGKDSSLKDLSHYTNRPLERKLIQKLIPQIRNHIKDKLPDYMIPAHFIFLDKLPLTPNGKVDRKALPEPDTLRPELETEYVPPRTPEEEVLCDIWKEVLNVEKVGIHDNFFDLGGHSLLATQVINRIRTAFSIDIPLKTLFERPTPENLSECIEVIEWGLEGSVGDVKNHSIRNREKGEI